MSAHFTVKADVSCGGEHSLASFCGEAGLVQAQCMMDKLILLTRLDHTTSADEQTERLVVTVIMILTETKTLPSFLFLSFCQIWRPSLVDSEAERSVCLFALPVGSELACDTQHIHHSLQLQLPTAYCCSNEAAGPANPSTARRGAWLMELFQIFFSCRRKKLVPTIFTCSGQ